MSPIKSSSCCLYRNPASQKNSLPYRKSAFKPIFFPKTIGSIFYRPSKTTCCFCVAIIINIICCCASTRSQAGASDAKNCFSLLGGQPPTPFHPILDGPVRVFQRVPFHRFPAFQRRDLNGVFRIAVSQRTCGRRKEKKKERDTG